MKWFKHITSARNGTKLSRAIDLLGVEGYGAYMIILEVVAEKMDERDLCFAEYSLRKWSSFLQFSPKKFEKFAETLAEVGLFLTEKDGELLKINIPNLLKYRDNHTKNLQVKTKQKARNLSLDIDKEQEQDKEQDKEQEEKNLIAPTETTEMAVASKPKKVCSKKRTIASILMDIRPDAEIFWESNLYPKCDYDGKGDCLNKYARLRFGWGEKTSDQIFPELSHGEIMKACELYGNQFPEQVKRLTWGLKRFLAYDTVKEMLKGNFPHPLGITKPRKEMSFEERVLDQIKDFDYSEFENQEENEQQQNRELDL